MRRESSHKKLYKGEMHIYLKELMIKTTKKHILPLGHFVRADCNVSGALGQVGCWCAGEGRGGPGRAGPAPGSWHTCPYLCFRHPCASSRWDRLTGSACLALGQLTPHHVPHHSALFLSFWMPPVNRVCIHAALTVTHRLILWLFSCLFPSTKP